MEDNIFFNIIIPNYNSEQWIRQCLDSVLNQTYPCFNLIIVDDMSTDDSISIIKEYTMKDIRIKLIENKEKHWNGGSRNVGINAEILTDYTLFLDSDDWFYDNKCLENLKDTIINNNFPDCVRLSYIFLQGNYQEKMMLNEDNPKDLVNSVFVAPWTKCIKTKLLVKFPENTLIEDVVQHIAQCDVLETIAVCNTPMVVWNRNNKNATSLKENQHFYNSKRISSIYRNIADLMDLQCKHDYCEQHRQWRVQCYKNIVREGKEETF